MKRYLIASMVMACCVCYAGTSDGSVLRITVTYQKEDPFLPWRSMSPAKRYGYGVVIGDGRVLTTESLVRHQRLVELRRPMSGARIVAEVIMSDPTLDLALLQVAGLSELKGIKKARIAGRLPVHARVEIVQFDGTSDLQSDPAQVLKVSVQSLPSAPYRALVYSLLMDVAVNGNGAGVFRKGKLAGLVVGYNRSSRMGYAIPCSTIRSFLEDVENPPYIGTASAGFMWYGLSDPAKRRYLGLADDHGGVLVVGCIPGSGADDALQPNDVMIELDGNSIDNLGFYDDPYFGRIEFGYLISGARRPGDLLTLRIVRNKKEMTVNVKLSHQQDDRLFIPEDIIGRPSEYLLTGGFLIREVSGRYIRAHGSEWETMFNPRLVHMYLSGVSNRWEPGHHPVILARVLADPVNIGYQGFRNELITHVNGRAITCIEDIFQIVDDDGGVVSLRLKGVGVDLVLPRKDLRAIDKGISDMYRVPGARRRSSVSR